HYFAPEDLAIFEKMDAMIQNEEMYHSQASFINRNIQKDKRALTIPPLVLRPLLEQLAQRDTEVEIKDRTYRGVDIAEEELPFYFSLTKDDQGELLLQMEDMSAGIYMNA